MGSRSSDAVYLLGFFSFIILIGALLLYLPAAWVGTSAYPGRLAFIDTLFTSASAVCVTGLVTADTSGFSRFGQTIIMLLIQLGGLGIISFTSILLTIPGGRLPLRRLKTIRSFSVEGVEYDPIKIVRNIVFFTLLIECLGSFLLFLEFERMGVEAPGFTAAFHAVSAFCNAGFSIFPDSVERFNTHPLTLGILTLLIVSGGIGFIVLQDVERRIRGKSKKLSYHSKVVLFSTLVLIILAALAFWLIERQGVFADMNFLDSVMNALFQSVTPRTAGFNSVTQIQLHQPSKFLTLILMFIGGAPGSIAGGIKVTTAYTVMIVFMRRPDTQGDYTAFRKRITASTANDAVDYLLRAGALLVCATGILSLTEGLIGVDFGHIVFESVSAFGTVGLSLGLTPNLSFAGKIVIIATMFAGRVGLIALAFPGTHRKGGPVTYPAANILLG